MSYSKTLSIIFVCVLSLFILEYYVLVPTFISPIGKLHNSVYSTLLRQEHPCIVLIGLFNRYRGRETRSVLYYYCDFQRKVTRKNVQILKEINSRVNNVLENSNPKYLKEVLIIDDMSDIPVCGWENDTRVRIIRPGFPLKFVCNLRA